MQQEQTDKDGLSLPIDVLRQVFEHLEVADLVAAGSVSREWRAVAADAEGAWQRVALEQFGAAKAGEFQHLKGWRDRYIACLLEGVATRLRSKGRYLDEMEDSATAVEKQAQGLLTRLNQMDRTLSHRRHDLNALLAEVSGHSGTHMDSKRGKELLAAAAAGGDLRACPRLTPDKCAALGEMAQDVEFWRTSIAQEREALHRLWDSLSYIQTCCKRARKDIADLQRRRAALEQATRWRPNVRRA